MQIKSSKCSKCGENNPPEAIMCWACYTPLVGVTDTGVIHSSGTEHLKDINGAETLPPLDDMVPTRVIPSWAYTLGGAVVALILLLGVQFLVFDGKPQKTPPRKPIPVATAPTPDPTPTQIEMLTPAPPPQPVAVPPELAFNFVALPNRAVPTAVIGIVPKRAVGRNQAAAMARYVSGLMDARRFESLQVYVIADVQSGDKFKQHQSSHQNQPLKPEDFGSLSEVWTNTQAVCVFKKGRLAKVVYPQTDPNNFWNQLV